MTLAFIPRIARSRTRNQEVQSNTSSAWVAVILLDRAGQHHQPGQRQPPRGTQERPAHPSGLSQRAGRLAASRRSNGSY